MRGLHLASLGLLVFATSAGMAACSADAEDCAKTRTCGGATTQGGSSSSSNGGPPPACVPGPAQTQVGANCGIFVATTGDDAAEGTQEAPVKTLAKAIELASAQNATAIYACTGAYAESVSLPGSVSLFGGLDCMAGWTYKDAMTRSSLTANADEIPLKIAGAGTVNIGNFDITAVDAVMAGGSSVAALVDGTTVSWTSVRLVAGAGTNGADGTTPDPVGATDPMDPSIVGNAGVVACSMGATDNPGGMEKANTTCNAAIGGAGGTGLVDTGTAGADGQPLPNPNPAPGNWGLGGTGAAGNLPCQPGQVGLVGADGAAGAGATGLGTISSTMGFVGEAGTDGTAGAPGQGGGGGGGAKGKVGCAGASGGGGGAGGCGGPGGLGGKGGGSSIALISLNASMTFSGVDLSTKAGGNGGNGGDGQNGSFGGYGGTGGLGAMGTLKGCTGGDGGAGGFGGKGGGGAGGHSIGIAYTGTAPVLDGATVQKGAAGTGGMGMDAAGNGAAGVSVDTQSF